MVFGYARVSANEQNLDLQIDAFLKDGIDAKNIYADKVSSAKENHKSLSKVLKYAREGDTIVVWNNYEKSHIAIFVNLDSELLPSQRDQRKTHRPSQNHQICKTIEKWVVGI